MHRRKRLLDEVVCDERLELRRRVVPLVAVWPEVEQFAKSALQLHQRPGVRRGENESPAWPQSVTEMRKDDQWILNMLKDTKYECSVYALAGENGLLNVSDCKTKTFSAHTSPSPFKSGGRQIKA